MSPKELNYIEDALGHEQFLMNQCQEAIQNLQDPALKNQVQQMEQYAAQTGNYSDYVEKINQLLELDSLHTGETATN